MPEPKQKKQELYSKSRRAVLIPLFLCLLAMFPSAKQTFEWIDIKFSDFLFTNAPVLRYLTGKPEIPSHPVTVITKDQTFFSRFNRDANRHDFAELTEELKQKGIRVLVYDFLFSEPAGSDMDKRFSESLASFPIPILATHFVGRGKNTFEKIAITDREASRPPWPEKLFRDFENAAAAKALINVASDYDSVIRYAPLAFHPTEMQEFMPSIGYAAWIASLIDNSSQEIVAACRKFEIRDPEKILQNLLEEAPQKFITTGHKDLDLVTRRLELKFIARLASSVFPESGSQLKDAAESYPLENLTEGTWLKMPEAPLPIIGNYKMPCLRIPFNRPDPPLQGDGLTSVSMGTIMETDADRDSVHTAYKYQMTLAKSAGTKFFTISAPKATSGNSAIKGRVIYQTNGPAKDARILLIMPETGFWQQSAADENGNFLLNNLPEGNFILNINLNTKNGWLKASMRKSLARSSVFEVPLLVIPTFSETLKIEEAIPSDTNSEICVFGEALPMIRSDGKGNTGISELPAGHMVAGLEEDEDISFADGKLINSSMEIRPDSVAALISEESEWNIKYLLRFSASGQRIEGLPTSLDSRLAYFDSDSPESSQNNADFTVFPGQTNILHSLPAPSKMASADIETVFSPENGQKTDIFLVDDSCIPLKVAPEETIKLKPGRYFVLTEYQGRKGIFAPGFFKHPVAFFGSALPQDQDFIITPINFLDKSAGQLPGVNLHASLFSCLSRRSFLRSLAIHSDNSPFWWPVIQTIFVLPLLVLLNIIFIRSGAMWGGLGVVASASLWVVAAALLFVNSILAPFFFPVLQILSFGFFRGYISWAIARKQEVETRQTFGRFISPAVVADILKTPDSLKPGGEKKELTVIFTDLAGFTSISEKLEPEQLTELMNEYLDEMTRILFKTGGTLDKYIGDAIMGFWNHPQEQPDHAMRSVECAVQMQKKLAELREKWLKQGLPKVEVRAGINSAVCMVGFIGSKIQMNFTCLGDGVNLASRLEGANKAYGTFIMIAESVHNSIDTSLYSTRFLDFLAVKGKEKPIQVFEVRGYRKDEPKEWSEAGENYRLGIQNYLNRNWEQAIEAFSKTMILFPEDGPSKIYQERCLEFMASPPPENWDGRYILKSK